VLIVRSLVLMFDLNVPGISFPIGLFPSFTIRCRGSVVCSMMLDHVPF